MPFVNIKEIEHCAKILAAFPDKGYRGVLTSGWFEHGAPRPAGQYDLNDKEFFLSYPHLSIVAF